MGCLPTQSAGTKAGSFGPDQPFKLLSSLLLGRRFSKLTPEGTHLAKGQTGRRLPICSSPLQQTAAPCTTWKEVLGPQLPMHTEDTAGQTHLLGVLLHTFAGCSTSYYLTSANTKVQNGLAGTQACSWLSQVKLPKVLSLETMILPLLVSHLTGQVSPWPQRRLPGRDSAWELCEHQGNAGSEHH